jgi:hypothetical protein
LLDDGLIFADYWNMANLGRGRSGRLFSDPMRALSQIGGRHDTYGTASINKVLDGKNGLGSKAITANWKIGLLRWM